MTIVRLTAHGAWQGALAGTLVALLWAGLLLLAVLDESGDPLRALLVALAFTCVAIPVGVFAGGRIGALLGCTTGPAYCVGRRAPTAAVVLVALTAAGGSLAAFLAGLALAVGEDVRAALRVWVAFMAVALVPLIVTVTKQICRPALVDAA